MKTGRRYDKRLTDEETDHPATQERCSSSLERRGCVWDTPLLHLIKKFRDWISRGRRVCGKRLFRHCQHECKFVQCLGRGIWSISSPVLLHSAFRLSEFSYEGVPAGIYTVHPWRFNAALCKLGRSRLGQGGAGPAEARWGMDSPSVQCAGWQNKTRCTHKTESVQPLKSYHLSAILRYHRL